jgi:hypothetical protein
VPLELGWVLTNTLAGKILRAAVTVLKHTHPVLDAATAGARLMNGKSGPNYDSVRNIRF